MATNLRLTPDLERDLKKAADRTGFSQQDIIRTALAHYLHEDLSLSVGVTDSRSGIRMRPPRTPFRRAEHLLPLPDGVVSSLELIDRSDRV